MCECIWVCVRVSVFQNRSFMKCTMFSDFYFLACFIKKRWLILNYVHVLLGS